MNASTVGLKSRRRGKKERGVRYFVGEDPGVMQRDLRGWRLRLLRCEERREEHFMRRCARIWAGGQARAQDNMVDVDINH